MKRKRRLHVGLLVILLLWSGGPLGATATWGGSHPGWASPITLHAERVPSFPAAPSPVVGSSHAERMAFLRLGERSSSGTADGQRPWCRAGSTGGGRGPTPGRSRTWRFRRPRNAGGVVFAPLGFPPLHGRRVFLDFQNAEVESIIRLVADLSGMNFVVAPEVRGRRITVRLNDVPWDRALDLIFRMSGLGTYLEGNIVVVAPSERIYRWMAEVETRLRRDASFSIGIP